MRLPNYEQESDGPNLTPVIDVVFLLLIFFLVATRFDQQEREMNINLAEVVKAKPLAAGNEVIVNVTQEGKYKVVEKEVNENQLESYLKNWVAKNPHHSVLIRSDGRAQWKYGVRVMGICNKLNIEKYRVAAVEQP